MEKKYLSNIIANDNEGLQMISACCAGAELKVADIKYLQKNKVFLLSLKRSQIEAEKDDRKVNSIYFHDVGFSSVRDNLAGISQRSKLRLRWYGEQKHTLPIFEVKTKNGRLGCKTTYPIQSIENSLMKLNIDKITSKCISGLEEQNIVFDEHLVPTLQVNYEREYYELQSDNKIRLTVDKNISYCDSKILSDPLLVSKNYVIVELKFNPESRKKVNLLMKQYLNVFP